MTMNKMLVTCILTWFNKFIELDAIVSGILSVLEDTGGCAKQYRCALAIYFMTVL